MVPLYAISSLISLFSLEAAFVIDVVRDIYEVPIFYVLMMFPTELLRRSLSTVFSYSWCLISEANGLFSFFCMVARPKTPCSPSAYSKGR